MQFSIAFAHPRKSNSNYSSYGQIILDDFKDGFRSSLRIWDERKYREHWIESIQRMVSGHERSALITDMPDLRNANFLMWWPMWNVEGKIYIQNHILFLNQLSEPFELSRYHDFVGERETVDEDGSLISEWVVTSEALTDFLSTR